MSKRKALLIGVPEYHDEAITSLASVVKQDITELEEVLSLSGYEVKIHGIEGKLYDAARTPILDSIDRFIGNARLGDTLLIYLSGHGLHHAGRDLLIPADAIIRDPAKYDEYLINLDFEEAVSHSSAETIIIFVDACRQGIKLEQKTSYALGWSEGTRKKVQKQGYVLIFACDKGEFAQYIIGEHSFSLFTRALVQALNPNHPAKTLAEVLHATEEFLAELARQYEKPEQKIRISRETGISADEGDKGDKVDVLQRVICSGAGITAFKPAGPDAWISGLLAAEFWDFEHLSNDPNLAYFKEATVAIVKICRQQWQAMSEALPNDPWRDEKLPVRILNHISLLVHRADPPIELTAGECALLLVAPFIREAVIASSVRRTASSNPLSLEVTGNTEEGPRRELEQVYKMFPQLIRKARRLAQQQKQSDCAAVALWLMYRSVLRSPGIWSLTAEGALAVELEETLQALTTYPTSTIGETLTFARLQELARCIYSDPERIEREDRDNALEAERFIGGQSQGRRIREKMLAYLLTLAGRLAIDQRYLSDVIIDHLGLSDPLTPAYVLECINQARWNVIGSTATFNLRCRHQAMDLALRDHIIESAQVLDLVVQQSDAGLPHMEPLKGIPRRLSADELKPASDENSEAVYKIPHIRFHLAQDEIREMLMGAQLYGDRTLAIRELYQNALDACRYRKARLEYLARSGQLNPMLRDWEGRIEFRQGVDETGRPYIECEDNGIGMGRRELSECFARAGRRFHDTPEFIEEQIEWRKYGVELYPNSQFGVGVFSYFMLADELLIDTCRLNRDGLPNKRLKAKVSGSGALFRVVEETDGKAAAGTRIRLYLSDDLQGGKDISCVNTLQDILWIAEFCTTAEDKDKKTEWLPGNLYHPKWSAELIHPSNSSDLWWVTSREDGAATEWQWYNRPGAILSDGIVVAEASHQSNCYIVNLCGAHRPTLTVDRKKILSYDNNWIEHLLAENLPSLAGWGKLTLSWLWLLAREHTVIAELAAQALIANKMVIRLGDIHWHIKLRDIKERYDTEVSSILDPELSLKSIPIHEVGCLPNDVWLFLLVYLWQEKKLKSLQRFFYTRTRYNSVEPLTEFPSWVAPYRLAVWQRAGILAPPPSLWEALGNFPDPASCPILLPNDLNYISSVEDNNITMADLLKLAAESGRTVRAVKEGMERLAVFGVQLPKIDDSANLDIYVSKKELELFGFISSWDGHYKDYNREKAKISLWDLMGASEKTGEPLENLAEAAKKIAAVGIALTSEPHPTLLKRRFRKGDRSIFYSKGEPGLFDLIRLSVKRQESLGKTVGYLTNLFSSYVINFPELDPQIVNSLYFNNGDIELLSEYNSIHDDKKITVLTPRDILLASAKNKESVKITYHRGQKFAAVGVEISTPLDSNSCDFVLTPEEVKLIKDSRYPTLNFTNLLNATAENKESISDSYQRACKLKQFGYSVPEIDLTKLGDLTLSKDEAAMLPYGSGTKISLKQILTTTVRSGKEVADVYLLAKRLEDLGYEAPTIDLAKTKDIALQQDDIDLLGYRDSTKISLHSLLEASVKLKEPVAETFERARKLALFGYSLPDIDIQLLSAISISKSDLISLPDDDELLKVVIKTAVELNESTDLSLKRLDILISPKDSIRDELKPRYSVDGEIKVITGQPKMIFRILAAAFVLNEPLAKTIRAARIVFSLIDNEKMSSTNAWASCNLSDVEELKMRQDDFIWLAGICTILRTPLKKPSENALLAVWQRWITNIKVFLGQPDNSVSEAELIGSLSELISDLKKVGEDFLPNLPQIITYLEENEFSFETIIKDEQISLLAQGFNFSGDTIVLRLKNFACLGLSTE